MVAGIVILGACRKCSKPVYVEVENIHGSLKNGNILLKSCAFGGDCEVDILKTPWATRTLYPNECI